MTISSPAWGHTGDSGEDLGFWRGPVAFGTREVEDDLLGLVVLRIEFTVDGGESAEQEIADVREDGGAARGNAILGEQAKEIGEGSVDLRGGVMVGELAKENSGEVALFVVLGAKLGVLGAEAGGGVGDGVTATAVGAGVVLTTRQVIGGAGVGKFLVHLSLAEIEIGYATRVF
jgi:hypothetical protein